MEKIIVIEFNYSKFEKEIGTYLNNSKNDYKFRNPLIESNNINLPSLQRIVDEYKIYYIGANYFIIYLYIKSQNNISTIMLYLEWLEDKLENFINFSKTYLRNNIMNIIKHEKSQYHDIVNQTNEKLELFNIIMENIKEMRKKFELQKLKKILIKDLIKNNRSKFSKDTISYFTDLGIYFLHDVIIDKNRCCSM